MTKRFRKVFSILCALTLLVSYTAVVFAEELTEESDVILEVNGTNPEKDHSGEAAEEMDKTKGMEVEDVEFPETLPEEEPAEQEQQEEEGAEEPDPVFTEPEKDEVISEPVTIQEAVEGAEEEKKDEQPAEEETPAEPAPSAPEQNEEEKQEPAEDSKEEPADQPEEKPDEPEEKPDEPQEKPDKPEEEPDEPEEKQDEPEEEPDEPEEEPDESEEAVYMDLDVMSTVSGILTRGKPFALIAADAYSRTVIFTLTVSEENAVSVVLNESPVALEKVENSDPASTDVIYTFEKQLLQNQVYSIFLTTEKEGYIPFTLTLTEKQEAATEETPETSEETTEEEEKTEETDFGLEEAENPDEEKNENTSDTDENEFPEEFAIRFDVTWDGDELHFGDVAHFNATVAGDEDVDYTILWQWSADNENWVTIEDEHELQMDIVVTEDNYLNYWRIKAELVTPEPVTP